MKQNLQCEITREKYVVSADEISMYRSFDLPLPERSPSERLRLYLSFLNYEQFFWRSCKQTKNKILSIFPPSAPFPVVDPEYWNSEEWKPEEYAIDARPEIDFFEELARLWVKVPRPGYVLNHAENSRSLHHVTRAKNSSMLFYSRDVNDCRYGVFLNSCELCIDCHGLEQCDMCYECIYCFHSSGLRWSEYSKNCHDSWFISNCINCRHCLFSANLDGKEYCVFNREVGKEEYERILNSWNLSARPKVEMAKEEFADFLSRQPVPHFLGDNTKNLSGNLLWNSKNCHESFEIVNGTAVYHGHSLVTASNCLDGVGFGWGLVDAAQFVSIGDSARKIINCTDCWSDVEGLTYSSFCESSKHLFGCVGLREKEYCIFNKQYTKKEYEKTTKEIIGAMKKNLKWGRFFPPGFSGFPYNLSAANTYMPISRIPARMLGFRWDDAADVVSPSNITGSATSHKIYKGEKETEQFSEVPEAMSGLSDNDIGEMKYLCEISGTPFQISANEASVYRKLGVCLPVRSFAVRVHERVMKLPQRKMRTTTCSATGETIETSFQENISRPIVSYKFWENNVRHH